MIQTAAVKYLHFKRLDYGGDVNDFLLLLIL
jgi:hypothetical protein